MAVGEMAAKYGAYYNPALPWLKPTALLIEIYLPGDQFNIFKWLQSPRVRVQDVPGAKLAALLRTVE